MGDGWEYYKFKIYMVLFKKKKKKEGIEVDNFWGKKFIYSWSLLEVKF